MTKEEFLQKAAQVWDKLEENERTAPDFYTYEKDFDELWIKLGQQTLEGSVNKKTTKDRRKKKSIKSLRSDKSPKQS